MLLEHLLTLDKPENCCLTRVLSSKLGSYAQYLTSRRHMSPTAARMNTKKIQDYKKKLLAFQACDLSRAFPYGT